MVFFWHFFASYSNGTSRGFYSPLPRYVTRCRDVFRVSGRVCTELFVATVITQVDTWTKESTRINKSSNSCSLLTNSLALSSILVQCFRNWTCSNLDKSFCSFGAQTNSRLAYTLSLYDRALMMVIRRWRKVLSNSLVYFSLDTEREMFLLFVFTGSGRTLRDGPLESSPIVHLLMEKFISSWTLVAELKVRDYCLNGWMNN